MPYYQEILIKPNDAGLVASILNAQITAEPEVTRIGEVVADLDPTTRRFTYSATVETIYGNTEVSI